MSRRRSAVGERIDVIDRHGCFPTEKCEVRCYSCVPVSGRAESEEGLRETFFPVVMAVFVHGSQHSMQILMCAFHGVAFWIVSRRFRFIDI